MKEIIFHWFGLKTSYDILISLTFKWHYERQIHSSIVAALTDEPHVVPVTHTVSLVWHKKVQLRVQKYFIALLWEINIEIF